MTATLPPIATGATLVATGVNDLGSGAVRQLFTGVKQPLLVGKPRAVESSLVQTVRAMVTEILAVVDSFKLDAMRSSVKIAYVPDKPQLQRMAACAARGGGTSSREVEGWARGVASWGRPLALIVNDRPEDSADPFDLESVRVGVPGHSPEQVRLWYLCSHTCDTVSIFLRAMLQCKLASGCVLEHRMADGTPLELVRVDQLCVRAKLAFSALNWYENDRGVYRGGMAWGDPDALQNAAQENHRLLRFTMRNTKTNGPLFLWCDPTARQVFSDLPLKDKRGAPLHAKFFTHGNLPPEYTAHGEPNVVAGSPTLAALDGVNGPCCVPSAMFCSYKAIDNAKVMGALTPAQKRASYALLEASRALLQKYAPIVIDWEKVVDRIGLRTTPLGPE